LAFQQSYKGVEIDDHLRAKHPENMTIVLQHQFADLIVGEDEFSVTLFFGGKPSPMIIPFEAVTSFNDPSVGFGLQFGIAEDDDSDEDDHDDDIAPSDDQPTQSNDDASGNSADVVSLDTFEKDRQNKNPMIGWQAVIACHAKHLFTCHLIFTGFSHGRFCL
jgi:hypothetical protein